jgi:hypothetical protein
MNHRPDDGGTTYLLNVGRQLFYTEVGYIPEDKPELNRLLPMRDTYPVHLFLLRFDKCNNTIKSSRSTSRVKIELQSNVSVKF